MEYQSDGKVDYKKILRNTKDKHKLKVTLKETEEKGVGLFATKEIKKGETIAYYKIKVFRTKDYESPTNFVYSFEVYRKNEQAYKRLIGDIYEGSFPEPINNIPFWAVFCNEPSRNERVNCDIDVNTRENYMYRTATKIGDTMIYKLVATKMIRPGEEILWYYGPEYARNYTVRK